MSILAAIVAMTVSCAAGVFGGAAVSERKRRRKLIEREKRNISKRYKKPQSWMEITQAQLFDSKFGDYKVEPPNKTHANTYYHSEELAKHYGGKYITAHT